MADAENAPPPPPADQDASTEAESQEPRSEPQASMPEKPKQMSFSIWPPAERTREAVVKRLIETLSTPSVLSNRYGTIPQEEASAAARAIEEEAFATANGSAAVDEDGIQILQVYSKEISKRMLEAVKARTPPGPAAADAEAAAATAGEQEVPNVEAEAS